MKLFYTKRSPYARKCLVIAHEKGLADKIELIDVDLKNKPQELFSVNPLGKIPALLADNGEIFSDSPVICEYIDSLPTNSASDVKFIPANGGARLTALNIAAIADGLMESGIAIMLERMRPEGTQSDAVIAKHQDAVAKTLKYLDNYFANAPHALNIATLGVVCALGYISFRLPEINWQEHKNLAKLADELNKLPSFQKTMPSA
jgi:glutathione S-transferase